MRLFRVGTLDPSNQPIIKLPPPSAAAAAPATDLFHRFYILFGTFPWEFLCEYGKLTIWIKKKRPKRD
jgi:hypothetical protein